MDFRENWSLSIKRNICFRSFNYIFFPIAVFSGLLLQIEYHIHHLPADYIVIGLNKNGWELLHKGSSVMALAWIAIHLVIHREFIAIISRKVIALKSISAVPLPYWLFILSIPTSFTAMLSWILFDRGVFAKILLIEIHDKLALLLAILATIHMVLRTAWMKKLYLKLKGSGDVCNSSAGSPKGRSETRFIIFDERKCMACWKCIEACPEKLLNKFNIFIHKHPVIFNGERCIGCKKCVAICDHAAIQQRPL